jgi:zinc transporter ZupT
VSIPKSPFFARFPPRHSRQKVTTPGSFDALLALLLAIYPERRHESEHLVILSLSLILAALLLAVLASAALGIWLGGRPAASMRLVPLSGGVLVGVSLFWILPEIAEGIGWAAAAATLATGAGLLFVIDRYVYPVCPACAQTHDHEACQMRLHGFAAPLALSIGIHSFLDGVGVAAAQGRASGALGQAVFWGLALHKVPEGLAMGVMLRASVRSWPAALAWSVAAQAPMVAGGLIEGLLALELGAPGTVLLLALAAGSFLFLGAHAVHAEFRRGGLRGPVAAALLGLVAAMVLPRLLSSSHWH